MDQTVGVWNKKGSEHDEHQCGMWMPIKSGLCVEVTHLQSLEVQETILRIFWTGFSCTVFIILAVSTVSYRFYSAHYAHCSDSLILRSNHLTLQFWEHLGNCSKEEVSLFQDWATNQTKNKSNKQNKNQTNKQIKQHNLFFLRMKQIALS